LSQARQAKQGGGQDKIDLLSQVSKGQIPGVPGKDYPVNSVDALKKKNPGSFSNLQPAPAHLITPGLSLNLILSFIPFFNVISYLI
jgi:hypothetical protein